MLPYLAGNLSKMLHTLLDIVVKSKILMPASGDAYKLNKIDVTYIHNLMSCRLRIRVHNNIWAGKVNVDNINFGKSVKILWSPWLQISHKSFLWSIAWCTTEHVWIIAQSSKIEMLVFDKFDVY